MVPGSRTISLCFPDNDPYRNHACRRQQKKKKRRQNRAGQSEMQYVVHCLLESHADPGVVAPNRAAAMMLTINDDFEMRGNSERCRNLQRSASVRNVSHSALKLGRLLTDDDEGRFQHMPSWTVSFFFHPNKSSAPDTC
jgi:hypothetical protein